MKYWISLFLSLSFSVQADILATWSVPTHYVDGTALSLSDIKGYVIQVKRNDVSLPDINIDDKQVVGYLIPTDPAIYKLRIATRTTEVGPFSEEIVVVDGGDCVSYNGSGYNRRTGIRLCGE